MTSQTITIPAREVRPGDVLFGMTVETSTKTTLMRPRAWFLKSAGFAMNIDPDAVVTVERPVPSDPPGTVRAEFVDGQIQDVYLKSHEHEGYWYADSDTDSFTDSDVGHLTLLWKPGMPIPTEGAQA